MYGRVDHHQGKASDITEIDRDRRAGCEVLRRPVSRAPRLSASVGSSVLVDSVLEEVDRSRRIGDRDVREIGAANPDGAGGQSLEWAAGDVTRPKNASAVVRDPEDVLGDNADLALISPAALTRMRYVTMPTGSMSGVTALGVSVELAVDKEAVAARK